MSRCMKVCSLLIVSTLAVSCGPPRQKHKVAPYQPTVVASEAPGGSTPGEAKKAEGDPSAEILSREPVANSVEVKHVLVGWAALAPAYRGRMDPRASARSQADAQALARKVMARIRGGEKVEALMAEISEDPGSASSGDAYPVTPDAQLVPEFIQLALRLRMREVGIVESSYGYHVMQRVQ